MQVQAILLYEVLTYNLKKMVVKAILHMVADRWSYRLLRQLSQTSHHIHRHRRYRHSHNGWYNTAGTVDGDVSFDYKRCCKSSCYFSFWQLQTKALVFLLMTAWLVLLVSRMRNDTTRYGGF